MLCRFLFNIQNTFSIPIEPRYIWKTFIFSQQKNPDLLKNSILQKPTLKFNKNLEKGGNFGRCKKRNEEQWRSKVTIKLLGVVWVDLIRSWLKYNLFFWHTVFPQIMSGAGNDRIPKPLPKTRVFQPLA